ncbi:DNA damage repair protein (Rad9), putative [Paecilomyces variotii No. 5]|uniref:DNA damage repair protein (Rad9), putative n=1 Tax=Byssochlamys spectabilis (strain No. 5 / NBRC 109023) TaxID=1356009 RepID=V5HRL0_BYSSN|nr:DNA damage repair protein (Rad9), putative [Paecilomyces variotii No. 5]
MESQGDSIDISQLKRAALGLTDNEGLEVLLDTERPAEKLFREDNQGNTRGKNHEKDAGANAYYQVSEPRLPSHEKASSGIPATESDRESVTNSQALSQPGVPIAASEPFKMSSGDSAPGDTQPISQSVFDSILKQSRYSQGQSNGDAMDIDTGADGATLATLHEGDTGHVDLLSGFGETQLAHNTSDHDEETGSKVGESSPLLYQPNLFPESQRFLSSTPATTKKQADQRGLSTATPSLTRNPIAPDVESSGGIMALSQVFQATQAPSSPYLNELPSGPMSDRPSPNIPIQNRPVVGSTSSPFKAPPSSLRRGYTEPQLNYISMKESQEQRDKLLEERRTKSAENIFSGDQSDDDFDREPSFVERLNRQRKIDEETNAQLASLTAPARPASHKRGQQTIVPRSPISGGAAKRSVDITGHIRDEETQGSALIFQNGTTSEEETEQEDDRGPTPTVRQLPTTEEDKENYVALPPNSSLTPSSAHDRLSQALHFRNRTQDSNGREDIDVHGSEVISSQQIVRDSQPSPTAHEDGKSERPVAVQSGPQGSPASNITAKGQTAPQTEDASDIEKIASSVGEQTFLSSPPPSKDEKSRRALHRRQVELKSPVARRAVSISSEGSPTPLPFKRSLNLFSKISSQDGTAETTGHANSTDTKEKSSSMPSRVAETPVHRAAGLFDNTVPETRIPETSPQPIANGILTNEAADAVSVTEEDDQLPPMYQEHCAGMDSSRAASQRSQLTDRPHLNAKILSSPSGRQRRALTEIASDLSPFTPTGFLDMDINLLTADDKEFTSVVGFSPIPARKKRRGNDGKNVYASDPIAPLTPRPSAPRGITSLMPTNEVQAPKAPAANSQPAEAPHVEPSENEPESSEPIVGVNALQRRRPASWRRAETVWEVDGSPEKNIPRLLSMRKSRLSSRSETRMAQERRLRKSLIAKAVVIHNQSPTSTPTIPESSDPLQGGNPSRPPSNSQSSMPEISVLAPNQVFACFNGFKRAYYPATCLGVSNQGAQSKYVVKFEDETTDHVLGGTLKSLELRIGDSVKVDMPNVQKVTHVVRGFRDLLSPEELDQQEKEGSRPMTDVYGYSSVMLAPKHRKSPRKGSSGAPGNLIKVPISRIYLDTILWNQLKDRQFSFTPRQDEAAADTPDINSAPATPNSRLSRSIIIQTGLFAGMVFAVSYVENEDSKSHVMKLIVENGGRLLRDGFNELFELPSSTTPASPGKSPNPISVDDPEKQFHLVQGAESIGFACLVADKHSRREKYMQALALGLPCLSGRWIEDCVKQNRILDWDMYLLPAGESMYLNGATKSRVLAPTAPSIARLTDTLAARPKLLEGQSVLIVMGRGKAEEKKKAYIFLTYALGASRVERVLDLNAAKAMLMEQQKGSSPTWNWIYVDDNEEAAAKAMILGNHEGVPVKPGRGRKRKRPLPTPSVSGSGLGLNTNNVRVVGNEFVCQSLILGKLFDE